MAAAINAPDKNAASSLTFSIKFTYSAACTAAVDKFSCDLCAKAGSQDRTGKYFIMRPRFPLQQQEHRHKNKKGKAGYSQDRSAAGVTFCITDQVEDKFSQGRNLLKKQ